MPIRVIAIQLSPTRTTKLYHDRKIKKNSGTSNSPFYSCVLGDLAFEWKRGWR